MSTLSQTDLVEQLISRRDSNPRHPAWELVRRLILLDFCAANSAHKTHTESRSFQHLAHSVSAVVVLSCNILDPPCPWQANSKTVQSSGSGKAKNREVRGAFLRILCATSNRVSGHEGVLSTLAALNNRPLEAECLPAILH